MNFVNLTPHPLTIKKNDNTILELEAGDFVRATQTQNKVKEIDNINFYETVYGKVEGLPKPQEGTIYIVSLITKMACPERDDLVTPGNLIRNEEGAIVGCEGLNM